MKVLLYFGTRPEIIKMYPVYKALIDKGHIPLVYFTKQHYSSELSELIFKDFKYNKKHFINKPVKADAVLVQGDTWSALKGALFASKNNLPLGHVEAGIRSGDDRMVEEHIRIAIDEVSDFLFAPTTIAVANLKGFKNVYLTGNTVFDNLLDRKNYIVVTLHRPENVDNSTALEEIINGITMIAHHYQKDIRFYCHPRTIAKVDGRLPISKPISYQQMIKEVEGAFMVITDSGGLQEESHLLRVPCITVRLSTERPETLSFYNVLGFNDSEKIMDAAQTVIHDEIYGDGHAGQKIVEILERNI